MQNALKNNSNEERSIQNKDKQNPEKSSSSNGTPEVLASMEVSDGVNKRPFRGLGLLNKSQLKLASYIKQNKNVTLEGTKRFMDKSGEYYLKNIQLQNKRKDNVRKSLNQPLNLENCLNKKDINRIKRKASKIVTLLPENSLTPIPKKKDVKEGFLASNLDKKELNDAQRTAVFIRRMEYSTSMKRQVIENRNMKIQAKKIALIQEWWKAMFKIIKLQKNIRGFLFRKKLMNNLEHQEKLLQFITEFDNIHTYHLYKQFMDNLKKKRDYEKNKLMEKCEDFNDKMDNLEKMHNYKNFKDCFKKWRANTKKQRKQALDDLCKKLRDILLNKEKQEKKNVLDKLKQKVKEDKLNNKINNFRKKQAKKQLINALKKLHNANLLKKKKEEEEKQKELEREKEKEKELEKEKEKANKLEISSKINYLEVIDKKDNLENKTPKKENQIFISPQNEINILKESPKKILLTQTYQGFSLISPDNVKFYFEEPSKKRNKLIHNNKISNQIDDVITFMKNKEDEKKILAILNEIFEQAKHVIAKEDEKKYLEDPNLEKIKNKKKAKKKKKIEDDNNDKKEDEIIIKPIHLLQKKIIEDNDNNKDKKEEPLERRSLLFSLKIELPKENDNNKSMKKRIAYRRSPKRTGLKNKRYLKNALDKWKRNSKLLKNQELYEKYKKKVLQDLLKNYKKCLLRFLKKYFDKWRSIVDKEKEREEKEREEKEKEEEAAEENLKYKKKPKFEFKNDLIEDEYEQETINEKDTFKPTYALPKQNIYLKQLENNKIDDEDNQEPIDTNDVNKIFNSINEKLLPYKKKYNERNYLPNEDTNDNDNDNYIMEEINPDDQTEQISKIQNEKKNKKNLNNNNHTGDTSSDESYLSGMTLILNNKEIKEPMNYISQSFFINKKNQKNRSPNRIDANNSKGEIYKINQIPNMMKGDFGYFIDNNPKILSKKNPRIQVTRATCDLGNIINNGNINININANNDNDFLQKIIKNCDYDLYANQKSKSKRDKWYSMSVPFNQLKQSLDYSKIINKNETMEKNISNEINNNNNNYTLQEMNCSQFYKSPKRLSFKKNNYGDNLKSKSNTPLIIIPGKQKRNIHKSLSPFHSNYIRNNNDISN